MPGHVLRSMYSKLLSRRQNQYTVRMLIGMYYYYYYYYYYYSRFFPGPPG